MPKLPNRGGAKSQAQPKPMHHTRSVMQTMANGKPSSQQSISRVNISKEQQKANPSIMEANDAATAGNAKVTTTTIMTLQLLRFNGLKG